MPGRIFFRDEEASVTSTELVVGKSVYPMAQVLSARALRHRGFLWLGPFQKYALLITTAEGEREVLRHRNGYVVFQLAKAVEVALREARQANQGPRAGDAAPDASLGSVLGSMATQVPR